MMKDIHKITFDLIYSVTGAALSGVKIHPSKDLEQLGINVLKFEGHPFSDAVLIETDTTNLDIYENLPDYIQIKCSKCTRLNGTPPGACVFKVEIYEDYSTFCTCCDECKKECEEDI